jgi:hypothetical protein
VNDYLKVVWREAVGVYFKELSQHLLGELRNITRNFGHLVIVTAWY